MRTILSLFLVLLFVTGCGGGSGSEGDTGNPAPTDSSGASTSFPDTVIDEESELNSADKPEIVDGDTIKVSGDTIRLDGIDAPEKRQQCRDSTGEAYNCGVVATEALREKVAENSVFCEQTGEDYYGRIIGTCYLGELDLNGWMVHQGHALAYREYSEKYIPEEQEAREAERGLWAGEFVAPWEWRRGKRLD